MEENGPQLKFEGDIFNAVPKQTGEIAKPVLTGSEQIKNIDEQIKKEITLLRIIKKKENIDTIIRVPTKESNYSKYADVIIEQDAILKIRRLKEHSRRFLYFNRVELLVKSREHGNYWTLKEGLRIVVDPMRTIPEMKGKPQKISDISCLSEENRFRLRRSPKLPL